MHRRYTGYEFLILPEMRKREKLILRIPQSDVSIPPYFMFTFHTPIHPERERERDSFHHPLFGKLRGRRKRGNVKLKERLLRPPPISISHF